MESRPPSIIDLDAELATLTMFRRTPQATAAERKGSVAQLATYRDGLLLAIKASGKIIGNAISPATSWFTSSTAARPSKSSATTDRPDPSRSAPE